MVRLVGNWLVTLVLCQRNRYSPRKRSLGRWPQHEDEHNAHEFMGVNSKQCEMPHLVVTLAATFAGMSKVPYLLFFAQE